MDSRLRGNDKGRITKATYEIRITLYECQVIDIFCLKTGFSLRLGGFWIQYTENGRQKPEVRMGESKL